VSTTEKCAVFGKDFFFFFRRVGYLTDANSPALHVDGGGGVVVEQLHKLKHLVGRMVIHNFIDNNIGINARHEQADQCAQRQQTIHRWAFLGTSLVLSFLDDDAKIKTKNKINLFDFDLNEH
jgi:hypothetical protein